MEWVAIDVNIAGNSVTHRLASKYKLRVAEAVGLLALTFAGMAQHAQDGSLLDVTDSQLEEWARWHGRRGEFATFFREQFCDEKSVVRGWDEYNGAHIKEAEKARERMRNYRRTMKEARANGATPTANANANGAPNVRERNANGARDVRHNKTGPKERNLTPTLPVADGAEKGVADFPDPLKATAEPGDVYADAWRERFGVEMRKGKSRALLVALARDHGGPEVLTRWRRYLAATSIEQATAHRFAAAFDEWASGSNGPAIAPRSPESEREEAEERWHLYCANSLLSQWPRAEYQRIGAELVEQGHYPSVEAFIREISITEPWTLNTNRISEAAAVKVIADRLRIVRKREATLA